MLLMVIDSDLWSIQKLEQYLMILGADHLIFWGGAWVIFQKKFLSLVLKEKNNLSLKRVKKNNLSLKRAKKNNLAWPEKKIKKYPGSH